MARQGYVSALRAAFILPRTLLNGSSASMSKDAGSRVSTQASWLLGRQLTRAPWRLGHVDNDSQQPAGLIPVTHACQKGTRLGADDRGAKDWAGRWLELAVAASARPLEARWVSTCSGTALSAVREHQRSSCRPLVSSLRSPPNTRSTSRLDARRCCKERVVE